MDISQKISEETELCKLAYKYGSDKCPRIKHNYTPFYYELLKNEKKLIKKVLEIGIGYPETMNHVSAIKGNYINGASLYMWRDFFPNAQIYGADINKDVIFKDKHITTFYCDQTNESDLKKLIIETGNDIDLFIDDASHRWQDQVLTCQILMPLLQENVIYIIEDVKFPDLVYNELRLYSCITPDFSRKYSDDRIILVKKFV